MESIHEKLHFTWSLLVSMLSTINLDAISIMPKMDLGSLFEHSLSLSNSVRHCHDISKDLFTRIYTVSTVWRGKDNQSLNGILSKHDVLYISLHKHCM